MTRMRCVAALAALAVVTIAGIGTTKPTVAAAPLLQEGAEALRIPRGDLRGDLVVDVAMDGPTWRMNDGTNPFHPVFTGQLFRGNTFIVSGRIYRARTLKEGGNFDTPGNPAGPESPNPIGTWVCRGTFNLDIGEIAAGGFPHVTSTQVFTFNSGAVLVTEGPEGGATVLRSVIGGAGRFQNARGEVVEKPLGVNTSNLFNVRFFFDLN